MEFTSFIAILIVKLLVFLGDITLYLIKLFFYFLPRIALGWFKDAFSKAIEKLKKRVSAFLDRRGKFPKKTPKEKRKIKKIKIFPYSTFWLKIRYFLLGFILSSIFVFTPLLFLIFIQELPNPRMLSLQDNALTTKIYDRNGELLYQIYANQNRTEIPLSSTPKYLIDATIAIEDKDFYSNPGFDFAAIVRSAIADVSGKPIQGGSTITQQLIKSRLLTPQISLTRKIKEIVLAFWAEKIYSKNQILEMYLNEIPYGGTSWGIETAAQTYFGKNAKDLSLSESAFLAGLPNAPTLYSPYGQNPNLWKKRQKEVLRKMAEQGYISKNDQKNAESKELTFKPVREPLHAPHFVMYVKDLLVKKYGLAMVERGGLTVRTTLDLKTQETSEKIVRDNVDKSAYLNLRNGAALITNPKNGDILAMVGSREYDNIDSGNYNATTAIRQPGSSIKVVTYAQALIKGFTAATTVEDSKTTFKSAGGGPSYTPVNYDGTYHGILTIRQALGNSINIPAVKILSAVGVSSMVDLAKKMGIATWDDPDKYGLAVTLGAADVRMVDMATVYGTLANQGQRVDLNPILKVTSSRGNSLEEKKVDGSKVMDQAVAFIISDILSDNSARAMAFGVNSPLRIDGKTVSVKTGTSDNKRDNWAIGYTPSYLVAVWVGNNDNSPMDPTLTSGVTGAAPIWRDIMIGLIGDKPDEKQSIPPDIIQKFCLGRNEYFVKGTENSINCDFRKLSPTQTP